jgi:hypothetical protein
LKNRFHAVSMIRAIASTFSTRQMMPTSRLPLETDSVPPTASARSAW